MSMIYLLFTQNKCEMSLLTRKSAGDGSHGGLQLIMCSPCRLSYCENYRLLFCAE